MHLDPWIIGFAVLIVLLNGLYTWLLIWLMQRRRPWPRFLGMAAVAWMAAMCALLMLQVCVTPGWEPFVRHWFYMPLAVEMMWNIIFLPVVVPVILLVALAVGLTGLAARMARVPQAPKPMTEQGLSRRTFIYLVAGGAAPATALGMGVQAMVIRHDLRVCDLNVPVTGLPPELEGFKIAHVSDLHSGIFCGPIRLRMIREMTNDLKADLVVVTGDIINHDMAECPGALEAIQGIESRYGTYLCEGNHDRLPGKGLVGRACAEKNLPFLYNFSAVIPVEGRRIILGGLPWMNTGFEGQPQIVSGLFPERLEGDLRILLAHHPHLFDIAQSVDLMLCGHTHGGQIMLSESTGLGPMFFKYWSGIYQRDRTTLVVSNGCGDWFPCRIGAPAEVGLLTLTTSKAS